MPELLEMNEVPPAPVTHVDPVCGMKVQPVKAAASLDHDNETYYFCGKGCAAKFQVDPDRYLHPQPAEPDPVGSEQRKYTCPMDPQIIREAPGSCPICGMALEPMTVSLDDENPELDSLMRRLWTCAALTLPLLAIMVSDMLPKHPVQHLLGSALGWFEFALATPVVLWGALPFFQRGWASIVSRHLNMFTLIAIGSGSAYFYSLVAVIAPQLFPSSFRDMPGQPNLYFEASAVITVLLLLGQILELKARSQTGSAIRALLGLAPKTARRIAADGSDHDVELSAIRVGDMIRIRPGEKVPTDGLIIEGSSSIDESMISGEPVPVGKLPTDRVIGGTINGTGTLVMNAERVGSDTLLAQIVNMVSEAQRTRAPIQRLVDVIASYFVPAVLVASAITFVVWTFYGPQPHYAHALVNAVAVLIIACPCALGLATPMAIMVGTGRGAGEGILIRNAEALELLEKVTVLIVDKTGTLTLGKPVVTDVVSVEGVSETELLRAAASLENVSDHPLAAAIVKAARDKKIQLDKMKDFRSITGKGITGSISGKHVAIGNAALMAELAISMGLVDIKADEHQQQGQTVVYVAIAESFAGIIVVSDPMKDSTPEAVRRLKREGIRIMMVTGDNFATAEVIARKLELDFEADVLPGRKAEVIKRLQRTGEIVAMAGDGINDAPALAQAHVGIAMGTGTDVAIKSAGITLVRGDLLSIVRARRLSHLTMNNIRQNLFFAFFYNVLGVPLAAGILFPSFGLLLNPMIAAVAMSLSSVSVIANALRLRTAK
jgi:Cu+-exporting ATPase